ncbi:MAG: prephenate dehydratase [Candidatus Margulisbacteria bacterium]|nr:prephenate dehydratase [Candidatus Margulisiibacteriota bacterium]MBU1022564.1 prephenate dehydratase [Candidatus Margulisiibacteriota bacterium]MBU1728850.1 prephenate dehydratase [Candidatus Margulisiibacteriota bacterium]MBU1955481.1 prephenate dehydratase [Candidatus Margulisiibacteriota bacterium]
MRKKIGFLGPEGTYCEEAGTKYLKGLAKTRLTPYSTIHQLLLAANRGKIEEAVVPVENSIEGTVGIVMDMLVKEVNLKIKREIIIPIAHNLIAPRGTKLYQVTDVISHPQAIDQCKDYLRKKLPKANLHLAYSTADAVKQVATSIGEKILGRISGHHPLFAAVGTRAAAKLYGLSIIATKINASQNQTRFLVLSKSDYRRTGRDKTSIVFSVGRDRPGGLHNILGEFASRAINLTKIESRPAKKDLGDYYFFIDMEGHREDNVIKEALNFIKKKVSFLKILGSYPKA